MLLARIIVCLIFPFATKGLILALPVIGIIISESTTWNIVWWVVWILYMGLITSVGENNAIRQSNLYLAKQSTCIAWALMPIVIWIELAPDNLLLKAALASWFTLFITAVFNYGRLGGAHGIVEQVEDNVGQGNDVRSDEAIEDTTVVFQH